MNLFRPHCRRFLTPRHRHAPGWYRPCLSTCLLLLLGLLTGAACRAESPAGDEASPPASWWRGAHASSPEFANLPDSLAWDDWRSGAIDLAGRGLTLANVPSGFLPELEVRRARVGLALSGGGARGLAHVGVLEGFEEDGLPIDLVVGTSMGGVIAGFYTSGYSAAEIHGITRSLDWGGLFSDTPSRRNLFLAQKEVAQRDLVTLRFRNGEPYIPDALVTGETLFLESFRLIRNAPYAPVRPQFDSGRIELGLVTTDIISGQAVYLDDGNLALALRGTMAVPIVFRPLRQDGMLLVDGGAMENIPVRAAKRRDADIVIAVDCATPTTEPDPDMPWEILNQVTTLMTVPNDSTSRAAADLVITPRLGPFGSSSFDEHEAIIARGREAYEAVRDTLLTLAPPPPPAPDLMVDITAVEITSDAPPRVHAALPRPGLAPGTYSTRDINRRLTRYLRELRDLDYGFASLTATVREDGTLAVHTQLGVLKELRAEGVDDMRAQIQLRELRLREGMVLRTGDVLSALREIHATQRYTTVYCTHDLTDDGGLSLTFLLEPAPPVRLGLGLGYGTDWGSRYQATLVIEEPLPLIGEELRLSAKFGEHRQDYYAQIRADRLAGSYAGWQGTLRFHRLDAPRFSRQGDRLGYGYIGKTSVGATALFNLRTWGRLSAGLKAQWTEDDLDNFERRRLYNAVELAGDLDTEDRRPYPTSGVRLDLTYTNFLPQLGSERSFSRFDGRVRGTTPLFYRLVGQLDVHLSAAESTTPATHRIPIGGLDLFPALPPWRHLALREVGLNVSLRYDLISRLIADAYIILRHDALAFGNERDWRPTRNDILRAYSVALALDTRLGPLEIWSSWAPPAASHAYNHRVAVNFGYRF